MVRFVTALAVAAVSLVATAGSCADKAKISTFAVHVYEVMEKRGLSMVEAVRAFKDCGVSGFDGEYTDPRLEELAATGLKPVMIYGVMSFRDPAKDEIEQDKYLGRAVSLGAKYMMIVPDHFGDLKDDPEDPAYQAELAKTVVGLRKLVKKCLAAGICPMVEDFGYRVNPGSHFCNLKRYFAEIPDLKFALDTGNVMYSDRGEDILDEFEYFYGKIRHVHVKDHPAGKPQAYALPGEGVVPNEKMLRRLFMNGYDGWVTLELFDAPDMMEAIGKTCSFINGCRVPPKRPLVIGLSDSFVTAPDTNYWPTVSGTVLSYVDAIGKAGHVPVTLCRTYDTNTLERVMASLDLLIMTGGADVDPGRYGEKDRKCGRIMYDRDRFDFSLLDIAVRKGLPVLGICRGCQIVNVYFGGSLCQDIPSEWTPATTIRHSRPAGDYAHTIDIAADSRLAKVLGEIGGVKVNSQHHQCVKRLAPGFRVVARAPVGVVEAIEHETLPIACLQFHPECSVSINDDKLLWKIYRDPLALVIPTK